MPVFVIGGLTLLIFVGIIISAQNKNVTTGPTLIEVSGDFELVAPHTFYKGAESSPLLLVEFSDFGCPACQYYHPIVEQIYEEFPQYIRWAFRHFPLSQSRGSKDAALAAQVAGEYGKFWEYAKVLFENQPNFTQKDLVLYADLVGINTDEFEDKYKNSIYEDLVKTDIADGEKIGINATPTFILNGRQIAPKDYAEFREIILNELKTLGIVVDQENNNDNNGAGTAVNKDEERLSLIYKMIDGKHDVLEIEYNGTDFSPKKTQAVAGQLVRWTNRSDKDITFLQLNNRLDSLKQPFVIKAGESFEVRLQLRNVGILTYKVEGATSRSIINIIEQSENIKKLLPPSAL